MPSDPTRPDGGLGPPRIAVVTFPGSNDDGDACLALELLGAEPVPMWHADEHLPPGACGIVLPGGFSYGDYLRCGALARLSPVMGAIADFAAAGGPVLGVCNGFQILCEADLLPGVLRLNRQLEFVCRDVAVAVETTRTPFTSACTPGQRLEIPVKHGEGNWFATDDLLAELERRGQIVLRYTEDVNGSVGRVAGVSNEDGNVLGLMPHPEHAVDPLLGPTGGIPLMAGLIDAARGFAARWRPRDRTVPVGRASRLPGSPPSAAVPARAPAGAARGHAHGGRRAHGGRCPRSSRRSVRAALPCRSRAARRSRRSVDRRCAAGRTPTRAPLPCPRVCSPLSSRDNVARQV